MLNIYNTLSAQKEEFIPREKNKVGMFVCGMTVYDEAHIGHARTVIFFDVVAKYLKHLGFKVNYIQNITDIDDRIINRAKELNISTKDLSVKFEDSYLDNMRLLNVDSVNEYVKATDNIDIIVSQIETLIKKGFAYFVLSLVASGDDAVDVSGNNDVYFDVSKFENYGKLSKQKIEDLEIGARVENEINKRNPHDFVLWKAQNYSYEPFWPSPWGNGRPGWHIEDTAITEKYLGQQYDIHGGAQELVFPHHEAEIAQQESASGKSPIVKYWMHCGWLMVNGKKMSKSLGNFITINDVLRDYSPEAIRLMSISSHYRSPLDFTDKTMNQFQAAINRITEFVLKIKRCEGRDEVDINEIIDRSTIKFIESMNDDFNTSAALASIFELIGELNPLLSRQQIGKNGAKKVLLFIDEINKILGIVTEKVQDIPQEVRELSEKRESLRKEEKWREADEIRNQILNLGYKIDDTAYGSLISKN